jgi:hypothetical protein
MEVARHTVAKMPTTTTTRLKLCCVVRTAFSPGDKSDHRTCPVSPVSVIDFRCGCGVGLLVELCVACAHGDVEKAMRPGCALRAETGRIRGRRKDGLSSAMASVGLYTAAIVMRRLLLYVKQVRSRVGVTAEVECRPRPRLHASFNVAGRSLVPNTFAIDNALHQGTKLDTRYSLFF